MSKLIFKEHEYSMKELIELRSKSPLYTEGDVYDIDTGETISISDIDKWKDSYIDELRNVQEKFGKDLYGTSLNSEIKRKKKEDRISELTSQFEACNITREDLMELINLKYSSELLKNYIRYDKFIIVNKLLPNLNDSDLGKFYKLLMKLSQKGNKLLQKDDIRSNPLTVTDLETVLNINNQNVYKFLERLKKHNVLGVVMVEDKKYFIVNPIYAYNGTAINYVTFAMFEKSIKEVYNAPPEVVSLLEMDFINSSIQC